MGRTWTDDQLIKAVQESNNYAEVCDYLGLSGSTYKSIKRRISELNLDTSHFTGCRSWTEGEFKEAVKSSTTIKEVAKKIDGPKTSSGWFHRWADKLNVSYDHFETAYDWCERKHDASKLLKEELTAYYWVGFILGDGSIGKNRKRISIVLSDKDKDHLFELENYLLKQDKENNAKVEKGRCSLSFQDSKIVPKVSDKFDIKPNKTKNPPDFNFYSQLCDEAFLSCFIGLVDADGSIKTSSVETRDDFSLLITLHGSWYQFLQGVADRLMDIFSWIDFKCSPLYTDGGHAKLNLSNSYILKKIKKFANNRDLPVMKRKWNRVNLDYKSKYETARESEKMVRFFDNSGMTNKEISEKTGLSLTGIYQIKCRIK
jgi:hypothetical protein